MKESARARANRRNAKASTGPRTADGKAHSARNALRHGLNVPVSAQPALIEDVARLAHLIAGDNPDPVRLEMLREIAEAQVDIVRIRKMRLALLSDPRARCRVLSWREIRQQIEVYKQWEDWEEAFEAMERLTDTRVLEDAAPGLAEGLTILAPRIAKLDRYERRALSRRKTAIRKLEELDAARGECAVKASRVT
jgi:hypothetical protein